jgi:hypothetical protein
MFGKRQRHLEARIARLEHDIQVLLHKEKEESQLPQIIIHQVDKVIVEQLSYSNNFSALEIKELTGKLNIGTNYTGPIPKGYLNRFFSKKDSHAEAPNPSDQAQIEDNSDKEGGPRIRMHARK